MRKIILAAAVAGAALSLAACSENTENAAGEAVDSAMADTEANADALGEEVEQAADDLGNTVDEAGNEVEGERVEAEADLQNESTGEAAVD